jgi:hypothetical protein
MKIQIIVFAFLMHCTGYLMAADILVYPLTIDFNDLLTTFVSPQASRINQDELNRILGAIAMPGFVIARKLNSQRIRRVCTRKCTQDVFDIFYLAYTHVCPHDKTYEHVEKFFPAVYDRLAIAMASHRLM